MITDEQARTAAERLIGDEYDNSDGGHRQWRDDRMTCVDWAIQELSRRKQHDDGPITAEWLESVGFCRDTTESRCFGLGDIAGLFYLRRNGVLLWRCEVYELFETSERRELLALLAALRGEPSENSGQLPAVGPQRAAPSSPAKIEAETRAARGQLNNFGGGR